MNHINHSKASGMSRRHLASWAKIIPILSPEEEHPGHPSSAIEVRKSFQRTIAAPIQPQLFGNRWTSCVFATDCPKLPWTWYFIGTIIKNHFSFRNRHDATVDETLCCASTDPHICTCGDRQWSWTCCIWSWGKYCWLCSPGSWPKCCSAKSGVFLNLNPQMQWLNFSSLSARLHFHHLLV